MRIYTTRNLVPVEVQKVFDGVPELDDVDEMWPGYTPTRAEQWFMRAHLLHAVARVLNYTELHLFIRETWHYYNGTYLCQVVHDGQVCAVVVLSGSEIEEAEAHFDSVCQVVAECTGQCVEEVGFHEREHFFGQLLRFYKRAGKMLTRYKRAADSDLNLVKLRALHQTLPTTPDRVKVWRQNYLNSMTQLGWSPDPFGQ